MSIVRKIIPEDVFTLLDIEFYKIVKFRPKTVLEYLITNIFGTVLCSI
jgi:hypothetical protein